MMAQLLSAQDRGRAMLAEFKSLPPSPGVLGQSDDAMIRLIEEGRTNLADYRIRLAMEARQ